MRKPAFPQLESAKVPGNMSRRVGKHILPVQRRSEVRRQVRLRTRLPSGFEFRHPFLVSLRHQLLLTTADVMVVSQPSVPILGESLVVGAIVPSQATLLAPVQVIPPPLTERHPDLEN